MVNNCSDKCVEHKEDSLSLIMCYFCKPFTCLPELNTAFLCIPVIRNSTICDKNSTVWFVVKNKKYVVLGFIWFHLCFFLLVLLSDAVKTICVFTSNLCF